MPGGFYGSTLDTIGMEYETISFSKELLLGNLWYKLASEKGGNFVMENIQVAHDASIEYNSGELPTGMGSMNISRHTPEFQLIKGVKNAHKRGAELVSAPLTIPEFEKYCYKLIPFLESNGDFLSNRASIHYHIGFMNNLKALTNILRISLNIDPVLFRLGGMGREFRGKINLAAYARPLMNPCAVPFYDKTDTRAMYKKYARAINAVKAMDAKSLNQFWAAFGVQYKTGGGSAKYHPCRYSGINYYSVPQHGTMEFRHFNQSHDVLLVVGLGKFLRGLVELSVLLKKEELSSLEIVPSNEEISTSDGLDILFRFYAMMNNHGLENLPTETEMTRIAEVFAASSFSEIPAQPVLTHIENYSYEADIVEKGGLEQVHKVLPPKAVSIHNIAFMSIISDEEIIKPKSPKINTPLHAEYTTAFPSLLNGNNPLLDGHWYVGTQEEEEEIEEEEEFEEDSDEENEDEDDE